MSEDSLNITKKVSGGSPWGGSSTNKTQPQKSPLCSCYMPKFWWWGGVSKEDLSGWSGTGSRRQLFRKPSPKPFSSDYSKFVISALTWKSLLWILLSVVQTEPMIPFLPCNIFCHLGLKFSGKMHTFLNVTWELINICMNGAQGMSKHCVCCLQRAWASTIQTKLQSQRQKDSTKNTGRL